MKENHTFDNYFATLPGADGETRGMVSMGRSIPHELMPDVYQADLCNARGCALQAIDGGKMDRFDLISGGSLDAYVRATEQDVPNYRAYARVRLGRSIFHLGSWPRLS